MPNVVEEFHLGNTKIQFCDDYCKDKTPEQIDEIMQNIMRIYVSHYAKARQEENEAECLQRRPNP